VEETRSTVEIPIDMGKEEEVPELRVEREELRHQP
jgi:hypothetical protein